MDMDNSAFAVALPFAAYFAARNEGRCILGEFMILQKFELCKVQLTHGANQLYIHGNEKLNCLGSTGRSRSQIKSFTVRFLYANSSCRLRLPCKGYNSIRTLPGHSAAMSQCRADWAG